MKTRALILSIAMLTVMFVTGCATSRKDSKLNVPCPLGQTCALQAVGDLNSVSRQMVDGHEITYQSAQNADNARHLERMANIEAKRAVEIERAKNPPPVIVNPPARVVAVITVPSSSRPQNRAGRSGGSRGGTCRTPARTDRQPSTPRRTSSGTAQNVHYSTKEH